jgi:hypothetical protein
LLGLRRAAFTASSIAAAIAWSASLLQVVKVKAWCADRAHRIRPLDQLVEAPPLQRPALLAGEDECARTIGDLLVHVLLQHRGHHLRQGDGSHPGP